MAEEQQPDSGPAWLADGIAITGFTPNAKFDALPVLTDVGIAFLAGALAWWLVHRNQQRTAEEGRRLERARLLHDLDREYHALMATPCARVKDADGQYDIRNLEHLLTNGVVWLRSVPLIEDGKGEKQRDYAVIEGKRFLRITEKDHFVDTLTLHAAAAWLRRIQDGMSAGIISREDVTNLWRHVLPWALNNRFAFMADLFSVSKERLPENRRDALRRDWAGGSRRDFFRAVRDEMRWLARWMRKRRLLSWIPSLVTKSSLLLVRIGKLLSHPVKWYPGSALGRMRSRSRERFRQRRRFQRHVPVDWSGDVAPIYHVIRSVLADAAQQGRLEILDYAGLIVVPKHEKRGRTDEKLMEQLFGKTARAEIEKSRYRASKAKRRAARSTSGSRIAARGNLPPPSPRP